MRQYPFAARSSPRLRIGGLAALALALVFAGGDRAAAQQGQLTPNEQAAVNRAISLGVAFLRQNETQNGTWGKGTDVGSGAGWVVGYTALAGITLIECGVPISDPGLRAAAAVVRNGNKKTAAPFVESPYEIALSILFLDRMGESTDKKLIQQLAVRLITGQTGTGGWAYKVPVPSVQETDQVLNTLKLINPTSLSAGLSFRDRPSSLGLCIKMSDDIRPKTGTSTTAESTDPEKARLAAIAKLPPGTRRLPVFQDPKSLVLEDPEKKNSEPLNGTTDNSNTHFATLGLWASRKYEVPTDRSFALLVRRFRSSQGPDGTWTYPYVNGGQNGPGAMTCVALLGLAIGHATGVDAGAAAKPEQDPAILNALKALSGRIGKPAGTTENRPAIKDAGGLYFMWAMERIAVLYDLRTLDNKDWYKWGMEILVGHQSQNGSWEEDGGYPGQDPILNTCFALLFLKRANLLPDLSRRFAVDSAALTTEVSPTAPPPKVEPMPEPPSPTPPETKSPAKDPPITQPAPETPKSTPPQQPVTQEPSPPAEEKATWPWILALVLLVLAIGIAAFFAVRAARSDKDDDDDEDDDEDDEQDDEDEGEKPLKKKTKGESKSKSGKSAKRKK